MATLETIFKYPRTPHLEGSRLQPGDEDLNQIRFNSIKDKYLVLEEKCDGANSAISFSKDGDLLLQSRGHYLTGGYRERHYNLMKQWAMAHRDVFYSLLGTKYVMYGEWMYAKHTVYYDALPHYFLEFDVMDKDTGVFLDTATRQNMLAGTPIVSVPVLAQGYFSSKDEVLQYVGKSYYISNNPTQSLYNVAISLGLDAGSCIKETELSDIMEGLYIKVEENGRVVGRLKFVRSAFSQCLDFSDSYWIDRPIIPNQLAVSIDSLFL